MSIELLKGLSGCIIAYCPLYRTLTGSLTGAIALSQLLYWASKKPKFWKTDEELIEETGLTINEWRQAKKKIKSLPFIQMTVEGMPAKTWYEIDEEIWAETVYSMIETTHETSKGESTKLAGENHETNGGNPPDSSVKSTELYKGTTETTPKTTKQNTFSPHPCGDAGGHDGVENVCTGESTKKPTHPRWRKYASQLGDTISKVRKVNVNSKLHSWAEAFRKLNSMDGVPPSRIRRVLKWYCRRVEKEGDLIGDNSSYLPIAFSGTSFRDKFLRIEEAMKRTKAEFRKKREDGAPPTKIKRIRMEDGDETKEN